MFVQDETTSRRGGIKGVMGRLEEELGGLARDHKDLLEAEMAQKGRAAKRQLLRIVSGALLLIAAAWTLAWAAIQGLSLALVALGLDQAVADVLSPSLLALALFAAGTALFLPAVRRLGEMSVVPKRSARAVRATLTRLFRRRASHEDGATE